MLAGILKMQISPAHSKLKGCNERFCDELARFLIMRTSVGMLNLILYISWDSSMHRREIHMNWGNPFNCLLKSSNLKNFTETMPPYSSLEASAERSVSIPADVVGDDIECHCCPVNNFKTEEKIPKYIQKCTLHPEIKQTLNSSWLQRISSEWISKGYSIA